MREALIAHPEIQPLIGVRGLEHVEAARASGRGVILAHCRWGPFPGFSGTLAERVPGTQVVVGSWLLKAPTGPTTRCATCPRRARP